MNVRDLIDHEAFSRNTAPPGPFINPLPTPPPYVTSSKLDVTIKNENEWDIMVWRNSKNFKCPHVDW